MDVIRCRGSVVEPRGGRDEMCLTGLRRCVCEGIGILHESVLGVIQAGCT